MRATAAVPRLATALVFANDAERLARFYEAGFGFAVAHREAGWIVLDAGGVELGIHQIPPEHAKAAAADDPRRERSEAPTKLSFVVEDFAAARARLEAAGARFRDPRRVGRPHGARLRRPEGNVFRIRQPEA